MIKISCSEVAWFQFIIHYAVEWSIYVKVSYKIIQKLFIALFFTNFSVITVFHSYKDQSSFDKLN